MGSYEGENDKIEWSLTDDKSVAVTHNKQCKLHPFQCPLGTDLTCAYQDPLELVSPILYFQSSYRFRGFVNGAWQVIQAACIVETNVWCGTHVHVSPG